MLEEGGGAHMARGSAAAAGEQGRRGAGAQDAVKGVADLGFPLPLAGK